jgi:hypothetical protein
MLNSDGEHVTKDGETIPLRNLTDSHLVNIIKYIIFSCVNKRTYMKYKAAF